MERLGYMLATATGMIWGLIGISALELTRLGLTSYEISFLRTVFAFVFGIIILQIRDIRTKKKGKQKIKYDREKICYTLLLVIISGLICQASLNIFFTKSISKVGTITAIVLMATGPIFTIILSKLILKEELGFQKIVALIIASIGTFSLVTGGDIKTLNLNFIGVLLGLASGFCYGFFPIINKKIMSYMNPIDAMVYSFGIAAIFLLFLLDSSSFIKFLQVKVLLIGAFYALVPTLLAYFLYVQSMLYISASTASLITLLEVPTTTLIGVFILDEKLGIIKILGIIAVAFGVILTKVKLKKTKK